MVEEMKIAKGYKQTEVGVIPEDWDVKFFKDICWVNQGLQIAIEKRLKHSTNISKKYITIQFLNNGKEVEYIDDYNDSVCCNFDDILMTRTGNTGIVMVGVEGVFHNNFFKINYDRTIVDKYYLVFYLKQSKIQKLILSKAGTSTIPDLNHGAFYSLPFITPPTKAEQTAIATALSDMDALIEGLEKLLVKKRNVKQGAMQELLKPKDGWVEKTLGDIAEIRDGTHQTPKYVEQGISFYSVENVTANNFTNVKMVSSKEHAFLTKNWKIEKGDILMTRIGTIGVCKYINWDVDASFYVRLALLKINKEYSANFICHYSQYEYFKKNMILNSLQFAYPQKINLGEIPKVKLIIPKTIVEQDHIAQILSDMDTEIGYLEIQLSKYKMLKTGMMQELLTGKKRLI